MKYPFESLLDFLNFKKKNNYMTIAELKAFNLCKEKIEKEKNLELIYQKLIKDLIRLEIKKRTFFGELLNFEKHFHINRGDSFHVLAKFQIRNLMNLI